MAEIQYHLAQVNKIRAQLGDFESGADDISKPVNMRTIVFDRRISRLKKHEKCTLDKLEDGLLRFIASQYYVK